MRIALCVSGQLRDEKMSFGKLSRMAAELSADVFISTWARRGTKLTGVIYEAQFGRMFGDELRRIMPREVMRKGFSYCFPDFEREALRAASNVTNEDIVAFFPNAVVDIEPEILCLDFQKPERDNNSLRMLYKIWRCNELKRRFETDNNFRYDLVIRVRPDVVPTLNLKIIQKIVDDDLDNSLWTPHAAAPPLHLGDTISVTNSENADYYASLFGRAVLNVSEGWTYIHTILYDHILRRNIKIKHISTEQWLTEDFDHRQGMNRRVLRELIERQMYRLDIFSDSNDLDALVPFFRIFSDDYDRVGSAVEQIVGLINSDPRLLQYFPREAFAALALALKKEAKDELYVVFETLSIIAEISAHGVGQLDSVELRTRIVAVFISGMGLNLDDIFASAQFEQAMLRVECIQTMGNLPLKFISAIGSESFSICLRLLEKMSGEIDFDQAKFVYYLHTNRNLIKAHDTVQKLIRDHSERWIGFDYMGHYHSVLGQPEEAVLFARKALVMEPDHWGLQMRVADLSRQLGIIEDSLSHYRSAMTLTNVELPTVRYIETLIDLGRNREAAAELADAELKFYGSTSIESLRIKLDISTSVNPDLAGDQVITDAFRPNQSW